MSDSMKVHLGKIRSQAPRWCLPLQPAFSHFQPFLLCLGSWPPHSDFESTDSSVVTWSKPFAFTLPNRAKSVGCHKGLLAKFMIPEQVRCLRVNWIHLDVQIHSHYSFSTKGLGAGCFIRRHLSVSSTQFGVCEQPRDHRQREMKTLPSSHGWEDDQLYI